MSIKLSLKKIRKNTRLNGINHGSLTNIENNLKEFAIIKSDFEGTVGLHTMDWTKI
jgi:hypothetical protein